MEYENGVCLKQFFNTFVLCKHDFEGMKQLVQNGKVTNCRPGGY